MRMPQGTRNVIRSNDSPSLWNLTLSPGWTTEESDALRLAVMKFGIGNWSKVRDSKVLPYKTNAQLNLQLQRLLGQQSTAEFAGLHIDPKVIRAKNAEIQGPDIKRKNNCIVNTGNVLTREELRIKVLHNKEHYEMPESEWSTIVLPKIENLYLALVRKKQELTRVQSELQEVRDKIMKLTEEEAFSKAATKCKKAPKSVAVTSTDIPTNMNGDLASQPREEQDTTQEQNSIDAIDKEDQEYNKPKKRKVVRRNRNIKGPPTSRHAGV